MVTILDATAPANKRRIQELGFHSHGMVILDSRGNIKIKMDGHNLNEQTIRKAIERVMGS